MSSGIGVLFFTISTLDSAAMGMSQSMTRRIAFTSEFDAFSMSIDARSVPNVEFVTRMYATASTPVGGGAQQTDTTVPKKKVW